MYALIGAHLNQISSKYMHFYSFPASHSTLSPRNPRFQNCTYEYNQRSNSWINTGIRQWQCQLSHKKYKKDFHDVFLILFAIPQLNGGALFEHVCSSNAIRQIPCKIACEATHMYEILKKNDATCQKYVLHDFRPLFKRKRCRAHSSASFLAEISVSSP